jgi:hypothetical protein
MHFELTLNLQRLEVNSNQKLFVDLFMTSNFKVFFNPLN